MVEVNGSGNTLTYYGTATNTAVKFFIVQALVFLLLGELLFGENPLDVKARR
jgi:hypothetical protein